MHKSRENKIIKIVTRIPRSCKENFTNREKECSCVRTGGGASAAAAAAAPAAVGWVGDGGKRIRA
jgi:hypothetical protein